MQIKDSILDYLIEEIKINSDALKAYEHDKILPDLTSPDVLKMREIEAIKLRDRIHELSRHVAVIKRMIPLPDLAVQAPVKNKKTTSK